MLAIGSGIFQNFGATESQLRKRADLDATLNYARVEANKKDDDDASKELEEMNAATRAEVDKK